MSNYATKTCYDCGIKNPANLMERVTESYDSGRSDNRVTAGNLVWAAVSDTAAKKVKRTIVANNRRSYTRNRTVWKCLDCSGHNAAVEEEKRKTIERNFQSAKTLSEKKAAAVARSAVTSNGPGHSGSSVKTTMLVIAAIGFGMLIMNAMGS